MALLTGDTAPDFCLTDTNYQQVCLSQFKGRTVLILFFPQAFTPVCTGELCKVHESMNMYNNCNTQVLAISVDSPNSLRKFKELEGFTFPMLSDFNKDVSEQYDVLYDNYFGMKGVSKRAAFVIDTHGKIAYAEVLEDDSNLPDLEAINLVLCGQAVIL